METIGFEDFLKVELRVGKILTAEPFPVARKPAYILRIDFGPEIGIKKASAQITELYTSSDLEGLLVVGVVNFPRKQIGPLMSECLVTGFANEKNQIVLCRPDGSVPLGAKLM